MAVYFVKVYIPICGKVTLRVKDPKNIIVQDLRPETSYGLVVIEKGKSTSHISVRRDFEDPEGTIFTTGSLNEFSKYVMEGCYGLEIYHNYYDKSINSNHSIKRLVIEKRDRTGITKLCDLHGFGRISEKGVLDGFNLSRGMMWYNSDQSQQPYVYEENQEV